MPRLCPHGKQRVACPLVDADYRSHLLSGLSVVTSACWRLDHTPPAAPEHHQQWATLSAGSEPQLQDVHERLNTSTRLRGQSGARGVRDARARGYQRGGSKADLPASFKRCKILPASPLPCAAAASAKTTSQRLVLAPRVLSAPGGTFYPHSRAPQ